jgi:homoserine dehydrogenase
MRYGCEVAAVEPVKVGLLGLGTVGGGTATVLQRNAEEIARRAGRGIVVTHAARNRERAQALGLTQARISADPWDVVGDPEIAVVVELIGGEDPALDLVMAAIAQGKHVVTANKALIALHGNQIFAAAREHGVMVAFEGAVAGGIPIIKAIREGLAGNDIEWLAGIINGTSNYVLTEMREHAREFSAVLTEAQRLGYAEADPTFDVEGIDAAHKLTILASIAFGVPLQFDRAYTEGISHITPADIAYAGELGYRIKHLGIARRTFGAVELRVHPALIPERCLLANVDGVMNAVLVKADAVGQTLYYGAGAGAEPTASAVVADLVEVVRTLTADPENRVPHLAFQPDALSDARVLDMEEVESAYYLRMRAQDQPGVLADISRILGDSRISIEAVVQKEPAAGETSVPLILLTRRVQERRVSQAIAAIEQLPSVAGDVVRIRMETLE